MSDFNTAFEWLMDDEDSQRKHVVVSDPVTPHITIGMSGEEKTAEEQRAKSAKAISGINSYYYPSDFSVINALPQSERAGPIKQFYEEEFWNTWLAQIISNEIAKRVFNCGVNDGKGMATRMLQQAINDGSGASLTVDGAWGLRTIDALQHCNEAATVNAFREHWKQHYKDIVARHPEKQKYLDGWMARAGR